jgi:hypothetical protein
LEPFSSTGLVVSWYLAELFSHAEENKLGPQTVLTASAAINYFFSLAGFKSPVEAFPLNRILRKAAERHLCSGKKSSCEPITTEEMFQLVSHVLTPGCSLKDRMHATVFLLMFLGLLRFNDAQHILVHKDLIQFVSKPDKEDTLDGVIIFIPSSKTDQSGEGAWIAIGATNLEYCPVQLLATLLREGNYVLSPPPGWDSGPLLRAVRLHGPTKQLVLSQITAPVEGPIAPLSYDAFRSSILVLAARAGIAKHIGLHSGRSGFANEAAAAGVSSRLICKLGRWAMGNTFDDVYLRMLAINAGEFFALTRQLWPY